MGNRLKEKSQLWGLFYDFIFDGNYIEKYYSLKKTLKSRVDFLFLILVVLSGVISFMESFNILLNYGVSKWAIGFSILIKILQGITSYIPSQKKLDDLRYIIGKNNCNLEYLKEVYLDFIFNSVTIDESEISKKLSSIFNKRKNEINDMKILSSINMNIAKVLIFAKEETEKDIKKLKLY